MGRTNVGTWRAMSDWRGAGKETVFTQTWHATSLHSPGKVTVFTQTWHAMSQHLPTKNCVVFD
ncbi:MAG: hypothetical protein HDS16_03255 [Bacteroides sp.]|nr:hypothetical protein [Bacteroides sp.]